MPKLRGVSFYCPFPYVANHIAAPFATYSTTLHGAIDKYTIPAAVPDAIQHEVDGVIAAATMDAATSVGVNNDDTE